MKHVAALRSSAVAVAFVTGLVSYAGPAAASAPSGLCSTHASDRITNCFLDLTKTLATAPHVRVNGGIFVGASAQLSTAGGAGSQRFASFQQGGGGPQPGGGLLQSQTTDDLGIQIQSGSVRLGDVDKVLVCDVSDMRDRRERSDQRDGRCDQYYEFLLVQNEGAGALDELRLLAGGNLRYDMDGGPGGDVSVLTNNTDGNGDLRALIPVSSFSRLPDDTFVYVFSTYTGTGRCQEGTADACPAPASSGPDAAAVPLSSTALLLGLGLVGMLGVRRLRSPDLGVSR
jgi:hypothetical protein